MWRKQRSEVSWGGERLIFCLAVPPDWDFSTPSSNYERPNTCSQCR
jgi:hypothetical protein